MYIIALLIGWSLHGLMLIAIHHFCNIQVRSFLGLVLMHSKLWWINVMDPSTNSLAGWMSSDNSTFGSLEKLKMASTV